MFDDETAAQAASKDDGGGGGGEEQGLKGDSAYQEHESALDRAIRQFKSGLFGVLFVSTLYATARNALVAGMRGSVKVSNGKC